MGSVELRHYVAWVGGGVDEGRGHAAAAEGGCDGHCRGTAPGCGLSGVCEGRKAGQAEGQEWLEGAK